MRVNSAFIGFFAMFFIASSFTKDPGRDLRAKQVNLLIRQIGHRLLLQAGDSTSRVLPVTEQEGTFQLRFENKFVFNHDSLMELSKGMLPKTQFPSGYTVTVHDCGKGDIVYGFQVNNTTPDILACSGRTQLPGCYTIEFAFPDFYEDIEQEKAGISHRTNKLKSVKVDPQEVNPKPEELKTTAFANSFDQRTNKLNSIKFAPRKVNPKREASNTKTFDFSSIKLVYSSILGLLVVAMLILLLRKILKPAPGQDQNHAIIKESVPELAPLGKFLFNVKGQRLLLGSEVISLTDKECKVLQLLHKYFGELIPRETLMQEIWINEGVITGRSLDMFVSKLRKKLSLDPELRITNIHGKGYKLEIPERQVI